MSGYIDNIRCTKCDYLIDSNGSGYKWHDAFSVCTECGNRSFYSSIEKWESSSKLLNPLTWGKGNWVRLKEQSK